MGALFWLIDTVINLFVWALIISAVMSWLVAFGIVNRSNPYVRQVGAALERLTEPLLRPIRRFLPDLGGIEERQQLGAAVAAASPNDRLDRRIAPRRPER